MPKTLPRSLQNPSKTSALPERESALKELLRRQVRAVVLVVVRLLACGIFLTLLKPLWSHRSWLESLLVTLGALLCGVPLLRDVARNWRWRIALGTAYLNAGRLSDAEALLAPLQGIQAQLFDADGSGARALKTIHEQTKELSKP